MDNTLTLKIETLQKAILRLKDAISKFQESGDDFLRDSVIKRFEFCFDLFWKTAKKFLRDQYGVDNQSPKETFRALFKNNLTNEKTTELLLQMTDDRNMIVHEYSEDFSRDITKKICDQYFNSISNLTDKFITK